MTKGVYALLLLALLWPPALGRAEPAESEKLESLEALLDEPVVTTASRAAERASTAPATVFSISAEDMRAYGIRSVDEALALLGVGMHVQKARDYTTGLDVGAQGIMLRDYGRHLLVLLDGHVMNSQASGEVMLHEGLGVPLEAIDHIEVMLGAGSVMYGANAMTAVVHIVTKNAEREQGGHAVAELSLAPPVAANGYARWPGGERELGYQYRLGAGAAHSFHVGKLPASFTLRAEWQQELSQTYFVKPVADDNWQLSPGATSWGGTAHHDMSAPSTVGSLRIGDFTLRAQGVRYDRTMPLVSLFNDQDAKEIRRAARLDLAHSKLLNPRVRLNSRLYGDFSSAEERSNWTSPWYCVPGQIDGCRFRFHNVSRWIGAEQQLSYEPRADGSLSTTVGYDVRLRDSSGATAEYRDLVTNEWPPTTKMPYFRTQSVLGALFAQQLYSPLRWLTMNLGARLDIDSVFGARLSPRAALLFTPAEHSSIRLSYAEAFRGPTALELNQTDITYTIAPSSLGPEIVRNIELEWQQRISFASFSLRGFVALYHDLIDVRAATDAEIASAFERGELASTADPEYIAVNDNLNKVKSYGGSLTLQLKPTNALTIAGSVTVSRSDVGDVTQTLWPRSFGNARASYLLGPRAGTLALAATFAHHRRAFNETDSTLALVDNPVTTDQLDLRLTHSATLRKLPGFGVRSSLGVRAFPDQPYINTVPTMNAPDSPVQYQHALPQLYLLLGVSYDF